MFINYLYSTVLSSFILPILANPIPESSFFNSPEMDISKRVAGGYKAAAYFVNWYEYYSTAYWRIL